MAEITKNDIIAIMRTKNIGMLTTVGDDGALYSHPMKTQEVTDDGDIYLVVGKDTEQAGWLRNGPQVNMAYSDAGSWLSVAGTIRFLDDAECAAKAEQLWEDSLTEHFTGKDDPNLAVAVIDSDSAQFWGHAGSKSADRFELGKNRGAGKKSGGGSATVEL